MDKRREKLQALHTYIERVDKEITMILQSLQWDRKHLLEGSTLASCKYDVNHRVPLDRKVAHEKQCLLRSQGYTKEDTLLPEPVDESAPTLVRFSNEDIMDIISKAAQNDPSFKRGPGWDWRGPAPASAARLQAALSADERRALHDAAVAACAATAASAAAQAQRVDQLLLPGSSGSGSGEEVKARPKSQLEVLAELRDLRRRRAKYRGAGARAPPAHNYSHVLRDVISTQMEFLTGMKDEPDDSVNSSSEQLNQKHTHDSKHNSEHDRHGKLRDEYNAERSTKSKDERKDRRHSDKYTSRHYRDASESRSEKSYKNDKHRDFSSRSTNRSREYEEKYEESRRTKTRRDQDDSKLKRRHDTKRDDEHSHGKKHKRHL